MQGQPAWGIFMQSFSEHENQEAWNCMESSRLIPELHVIVPSSETKMASTPSVCSTICIPFFNPREKQVVLSASPSMEMSLMMVIW